MLEYYGYIYCITSPTNRNYVGQKRSSIFIEDYWGTPGINNDLYKEYKLLNKQGIFSNQYESYGYKREILEWCNNQEELNKQEKYWIKEKQAHITQGGYNRSWGLGENSTFSGWSTGLHWYNNGEKEICCIDCPEGWKKGRLHSTFIKQSNSLKERYEKDENLKNRTGRKNKGRHRTEKDKQNISIGLRKMYNDSDKGIEVKRKLSEASKGNVPTNKGLYWFNNGIENVQATKCPEGFKRGLLRKSIIPWNKGQKMSEEYKINHPSQGTKGYRWYNNGEKQIFSKEYPGEGWILGKMKKIKKKDKNKTVLYSKEWRDKVSQSLRLNKKNNGKSWWNNGIKEIFQFECPEGFTKGRIKRSKNV